MAVVLKGLAFAWATILAVHLAGRYKDDFGLERTTYLYLALTLFFAGMATGSGKEVPNWLLGVGLWFGGAGFGYAIRWQVDEDLHEGESPER